jgi:hypothetical protein
MSALRTGRLYPWNVRGTRFHYRLSRPQEHGAVGRKYVTEKSSDTTGNRFRDRPTSSHPRSPSGKVPCIIQF